MRFITYISLFLSLSLNAQIEYSGWNPEDVTRHLGNVQAPIDFGNECGVPYQMKSNVYGGMEFNGFTVNLRYIVLDVYGKLTNFGVEITLMQALSQGLLKLECDDSEITVHEETLSITEATKFEFKVYPNPTTDIVNVVGIGINLIEIIDMQGRTLYKVTQPSIHNRFNINLESGMYLVIVNNEVKKLMVK